MRCVKAPQMTLGQVDISAIRLDPKSRDDIPQLLRGLQYIYGEPAVREAVFKVLETVIPTRVGKGLDEAARAQPASPERGRPGMEQWKILVLGVIRLGLNTDYDRLTELANEHKTLRLFLGHDGWLEDDPPYQLQTLKDNLRLFTPEILDQINQIVVKAGHQLLKKSPEAAEDEPIYARADSFVVETDVHYPTDLNLLYDAVRKTIEISHDLAETAGLAGWRQAHYWLRQAKRALRTVNSRKTTDQEAAVFEYLHLALDILARSRQTVLELQEKGITPLRLRELETYQGYIALLQDQVHRRLINGEVIPHHEKVFSLFEPHTEWVVKGKAGVPVELGVRVAIAEDQYRFILHHRVMQQQTDDKVALPLAQDLKQRFPQITGLSFDKGFHSPANQTDLAAILDEVTLPKKGRCNAEESEREASEGFRRHRRQHAAVESAINALEHGGLDRCPDHGIEGFTRYVALAVVARNLKRLGQILQQGRPRQARRRPLAQAA